MDFLFPLPDSIGAWHPWTLSGADIRGSGTEQFWALQLDPPEMSEFCCGQIAERAGEEILELNDLAILGVPVRLFVKRRWWRCPLCGKEYSDSAPWIDEAHGCTVRYEREQRHQIPIAKAMVVLQEERRLFFGGPMVVFKWLPSEALSVVYVSPNVEEIFGYPPPDFFADRIHYADLIHPQDQDAVQDQLRTYLQTPNPGNLKRQYRLRHASGEWRWVEEHITAQNLLSGFPGVLNGYVLDVTDWRRAEENLRAYRERLDLVLESTQTGLWMLDLSSRKFYGSQTWLEKIGFRSDFLEHGSWHDWVHPEDLPGLQEQVIRCLARETTQIDAEVRFRGEINGEWRWVHLRAVLSESSEDSEKRSLVGIIADISARKQMEIRLANEKKRLESIFQSVQSCLVILDAQTHRILDANPAACALLGRTREEMLGQSCFSFICPACEGKCPMDLSGAISNAERDVLHADGHRIPILKTVTAVELDGRLCYIESFVDISHRLKAEQALREHILEIERMNRLMLDREYRVLELKYEINQLCRALNMPERYQTAGVDHA